MLQDEDVEALIALRLTSLQAKVYLALATLGAARITKVSKDVHVARQDIYRIIDELEKLGLVEKVIATPCLYRGIPLQEGVNILLQRIHQEKIESQKKAINLIERYKYLDRHEKAQSRDEEYQFVLISEREALAYRLKQSIETAKKNIDVICSWKTCLRAMFDLAPKYQQALKRSVKIRWITNKPDEESWPKIMQTFLENPQFKIGYTTFIPEQRFGIYDNTVFLAVHPNRSYLKSPALWSNAHPLVGLAQNYFDVIWNTAVKSLNLAP